MFCLPFELPGFTVTHVESREKTVVIDATAQKTTANCPGCQQPSLSVHSYYQRSPQDLPVSGKTVRLVLRVRRFRCQNPQCAQRTFAERHPEVLASSAQRTERLTSTLAHFAGGESSEPAAPRLSHLGIIVSPDTLLRLAKHAPEVPLLVPKAVGVDDFAFRRGRSYGTLLVDLNSHHPIDVLPDRSADTLARWLGAHPGVEYLSRDRSPEYARGASEGAPSAQQVADRWHILKNLREVLERLLGRVHARLKQRYDALAIPIAHRKRQRTKNEAMASQVARLRREARYQEVVSLYQQGTPLLGIADALHMSRTTVRKLVAAGAFPERADTFRSKSILDPYVPYLRQRLAQGTTNASQLWRDLREQGFSGGYKVVARWLQGQGWQLRKGRFSQASKLQENRGEITPTENKPTGQPIPLEQTPSRQQTSLREPLESPRHLVWLLLLEPSRLSQAEQEMLLFIRQDQAVEVAYLLAQQFVQLMRAHRAEELDGWLCSCAASQLPDLETFASGLQKEVSAIRAAVLLPYSNGPTEGHINRLKLIKRSMYNRGSFDLLRRRVLYSEPSSLPLHERCG
jgi:transposase